MNNHTHMEYLGDGVYASYDGYQIWLAANRHDNHVITINPTVYHRLVEYAERLRKEAVDASTDGMTGDE